MCRRIAGYNQKSCTGVRRAAGYPGDASSSSTPSGPRGRGGPRHERVYHRHPHRAPAHRPGRPHRGPRVGAGDAARPDNVGPRSPPGSLTTPTSRTNPAASRWSATSPCHGLTHRGEDRPAASRHGVRTGCGCAVTASRRLHLGTALDIMRPGAGARDPDLVSPSADIHSSLAHVGQVVRGRSRQARSSRISLVESGLRQAAPLCRGHCQADAPVTRHEPPRFFLASETNLRTMNANGTRLVLRTI